MSNLISRLTKRGKPDIHEGIPEAAARLIEQITRPGPVRVEEVTKIARDFLRDPGAVSTGDRNLTAYLLVSFFSGNIPVEVTQTLTQIVQEAQVNDPAVQQLANSTAALKGEVAGYFRFSTHAYDYFQPAPLSGLLAKDILALEIHRLVVFYRRQFKEEKSAGYWIQGFANPKAGSPGVWMSNQGIKFDPKKL